MTNFRPLLNRHLRSRCGAKTQRDFKRICRVVQIEFASVRCPALSLVRVTLSKIKCRRSVAVGVDDLQRRLPNITVARLRIKFVIAKKFCIRISRANRALIKPPIVANLKIHHRKLLVFTLNVS